MSGYRRTGPGPTGRAREGGPGDLLVERLQEWAGLAEVTLTWLASVSDNTRRAYTADLAAWVNWCEAERTPPLIAHWRDAERFIARQLETGLATASVRRRASVCATWYRVLVRADLTDANPFAATDWPTKGRHPPHAPARTDPRPRRPSARNRALLWLLSVSDALPTSILALDVENIEQRSGRRVLRVPGGRGADVPLAPGNPLDTYLTSRGNPASGPLFITRSGGRLSLSYVGQLRRNHREEGGTTAN